MPNNWELKELNVRFQQILRLQFADSACGRTLRLEHQTYIACRLLPWKLPNGQVEIRSKFRSIFLGLTSTGLTTAAAKHFPKCLRASGKTSLCTSLQSSSKRFDETKLGFSTMYLSITLHYYAQNRVTSIVNATDTTYPISDVRLRRSILIAMGSTGQKPHLALLRPWTLLGAWTLVGLLASLLGARTLLAAPGLTTGNNVCY